MSANIFFVYFMERKVSIVKRSLVFSLGFQQFQFLTLFCSWNRIPKESGAAAQNTKKTKVMSSARDVARITAELEAAFCLDREIATEARMPPKNQVKTMTVKDNDGNLDQSFAMNDSICGLMAGA